MRYSKQRELVLQKVEQLCDHPTAEEIFDLAARECPGLSLGTVYRNLNQLADAGQLKKIPLPDGSCRFDGTLSRHSHIVCERCGRVMDVSVDTAWLGALVARQTQFSLTSAELVMRGVCSACAHRGAPAATG